MPQNDSLHMNKIKIEQLDKFHIARDDLLPGGTKRRALEKWLPSLDSDHFIYVGSVYGSGGWALAEACKELGFGCTLYIPQSPYEPDWLNSLSLSLRSFPSPSFYEGEGSREREISVIRTDPMPVQDLYDSLKDQKGLLPLGYDDPYFKNCLADVFKSIDMAPSEIWMPCVSGVLVQAARQAWPDIPLNAVCVAKHHGDLGKARKYQASEKYHQRAQSLPPYPSNLFSDAKLWQFASRFALNNALIWNTSI